MKQGLGAVGTQSLREGRESRGQVAPRPGSRLKLGLL